MHVAAVNPQVVSPDQMAEEVVAKEREIYAAQAQESGKPAEIVEKMIDGRIRKFLSENSLTEQAFVKDPDTTVGKLVSQQEPRLSGLVALKSVRVSKWRKWISPQRSLRSSVTERPSHGACGSWFRPLGAS